MSVRVTWLPNTEADIASYDLQRAPDVAGAPGTFVDVITIVHDLLGPDFDIPSNRFFYDDVIGVTTDWYRLRATDTNSNNSGWSNPFQPSTTVTPPPFPNTVNMNEDYGGTNALQYTEPGGDPIEDAQVRVYKKVDYDLENFDAALGVTTTNATGGWVNPVIVTVGFTYTIQFYKPGAFGPDAQEVVVP
jgi:hypothetical protein